MNEVLTNTLTNDNVMNVIAKPVRRSASRVRWIVHDGLNTVVSLHDPNGKCVGDDAPIEHTQPA
eukprot:3447425-Heterocapsa_arctica.AAC.1